MAVWVGFDRAMALASAMGLASLGSSGIAAQPAPVDTCHLALISRYIGAQAVPAVRAEIRAMTSPLPLRWIRPGQAITTDYSAQRLNVILDEHSRIMAMRCG
jgi:hypothetical protein